MHEEISLRNTGIEGKGFSEIEGKAARVAAKERGQRLSFKAGISSNILQKIPAFLLS